MRGIARALGVLVLLSAPDARSEEAYRFGNEAQSFVLGGLTTGGSFGSAGGGGFVGGELSLVWLKEALWGGLFVDGAYDFAHGAGTFVFGPEFGFAMIGFDGGVGLRVGLEDDPEIGYHGRLLIALGTFSLFGRYGFWPDSEAGEHVGQVGVILKLPFWSSSPVPKIAR